MNQTFENDKKPSFGPDFGPNSDCQLFKINLASSLTRYHGQLSSCTISKEANDSFLRKRSDGRTDRQMDESDFIRCSPTNLERPAW